MKAVVAAGLTTGQAFFIDYLYGQKQVSARTVESYRDTFRLLLRFLQQTTRKAPSALHTLDLDAPVILSFLDHLECQRNNQPQSRNVRLAAVRPFFEWRQSEIQAVGISPTKVRKVPQDSCQLPGRKRFSAIPELPNGTWFSRSVLGA